MDSVLIYSSYSGCFIRLQNYQHASLHLNFLSWFVSFDVDRY